MLDIKNINNLRVLDAALVETNNIAQKKGQSTSWLGLLKRTLDDLGVPWADSCCNSDSSPTFCNALNSCLGISSSGSTSLFLNQKGQFISTGGGGTPSGTPTQVAYFDTTTGLLTSDGGFTRDSDNNFRTLITAQEAAVQNTLDLNGSSLSLLSNDGSGGTSGIIAAQGIFLKIYNNNSNVPWLWPTSDAVGSLNSDGAGNLSFGQGNNWSLTGNSGTTPGTNFIGTIDNQDLVFKVNNILSGVIDTQLDNTSFGTSMNYLTGFGNTAFGSSAGAANTTGTSNTFIGLGAGVSNLTGSSLVILGASSDVASDGISNSISLGAGAGILFSNQIVFGQGVSNWRVNGVNWVMPSSNVHGYLTNDGSGNLSWVIGTSGTFTTVDLKTVTVVNGIITSIV